MNDRNNTIAGWVLFAGIVALGGSIVSGEIFHSERPETMGFPIEGVAVEGEGAEAEKPIAFYLASADPTKGEQVFKKCAACHNADKGGANALGPNLWGVLGEPVGKGHGFAFSEALAGKGGAWDWQNLSDWLANPKKFAPGTKMTFAGLSNPEERANIIAFLNAHSDAPRPLPAAPAEATAATDAKAAAEAEKPISFYLASADPTKGEQVFKKCAACHNADKGGANALGPNLWGVLGEPVGKGHGFAFSEALAGKGGTWDWQNLSDWLANPKKFAPGTKMTFAGLSNPEERANIIAFLNAHSDAPRPLPAAPAEATAATDAKAAAEADDAGAQKAENEPVLNQAEAAKGGKDVGGDPAKSQ